MSGRPGSKAGSDGSQLQLQRPILKPGGATAGAQSSQGPALADGPDEEAALLYGKLNFLSEEPSAADAFLMKSRWFRTDKRKELEAALTEPKPLMGNLYRYVAVIWGCKGLPWWIVPIHKLLIVMAIQILAPVGIIWWAVVQFDWREISIGFNCLPSFWEDPPAWFGRILSALFLYCFANSMSAQLREEQLADRKLEVLAFKDVKVAELFRGDSKFLLFVGRMVNEWVTVSSCVAMWLVFQLGLDPKDVVFDSMALSFVAGIDKVAGDMNMLSNTQWEEDVFGKYWNLVMGSSVAERPFRGEKRTAAHTTSVEVRNFLLDKIQEVHPLGKPAEPDLEVQSSECGDLDDDDDDQPDHDAPNWDRGQWWVPSCWTPGFHRPVIKRYVQSEQFVSDLRLHMNVTKCIEPAAQMFLFSFSVWGPISFLLCQIKVREDVEVS